MAQSIESYNEEYYSKRGTSLELKAEIKDLITLLKPNSTDRILEIGCGGGDLLVRLERYNERVVGVDHSLRAVQMAKRRVATCNILVGSSHMLSFRDNMFDKIVCQHVIEHLDNIQIHFMEWRRVLRERGYLVLATPNLLHSDHNVFYDPGHKHIYSVEELTRLLEENSFLVIDAYTIIPKLSLNVFGRIFRLGTRLWRLLKFLHFRMRRGQTIVLKARMK